MKPLVGGAGEIGGFVLNFGEGKVYWTDFGYGKIRRSNLDGTEREDLLIELGKPDGLALNCEWPQDVLDEP